MRLKEQAKVEIIIPNPVVFNPDPEYSFIHRNTKDTH